MVFRIADGKSAIWVDLWEVTACLIRVTFPTPLTLRW